MWTWVNSERIVKSTPWWMVGGQEIFFHWGYDCQSQEPMTTRSSKWMSLRSHVKFDNLKFEEEIVLKLGQHKFRRNPMKESSLTSKTSLVSHIYLWSKVVCLSCFVCTNEIHPTKMLQITFLVSLESSWGGGVHHLGFIMSRLEVQKFLNIEWFLQ